jgi:hypothetical protein
MSVWALISAIAIAAHGDVLALGDYDGVVAPLNGLFTGRLTASVPEVFRGAPRTKEHRDDDDGNRGGLARTGLSRPGPVTAAR